MPLQYMLYNARVKINLPNHGEVWFFIDPKHTVSQFVSEVISEDKNSIESLEVLRGNGGSLKTVAQTEYLYEQL